MKDVLIAAALLLTGCSADLDRSQALDLIRQAEEVDDESIEFTFQSGGNVNVGLYPARYTMLEELGWIAITRHPQYPGRKQVTIPSELPTEIQSRPWPAWVSFPERDNTQWVVHTADREVVDVTGLQITEERTHAEFSWRWSPTTIGRAVFDAGLTLEGNDWSGKSDALQGGSAYFLRYDDGWRLVDISF